MERGKERESLNKRTEGEREFKRREKKKERWFQ
jgi:hypothetical protein